MATGTTADSLIKRNRIIEQALRACRALKQGEQADANKMRDGITTLNEILREEDQDQTGQKRSLWAMSEDQIFLTSGVFVYTNANGLPSNIQDLQYALFRDITGEDTPLDIVSPNQYEALTPKDEVGDPEKVLLVVDRLLSSQSLKVWPVPTSVGTTSVVVGSDGSNYQCIQGHTSSDLNKPATGVNYRHFWKKGGSGGSTWARGSSYTNGVLIQLSYKRPLFDFDLPDDDPDLPSGWGMYLKWRLAIELSPIYKVPLEERVWFERQLERAKKMLFPNTQVKTTDVHNKAKYF